VFEAFFFDGPIPAFKKGFLSFSMGSLRVIEVHQVRKDRQSIFGVFDLIALTFLRESTPEVVEGLFYFTFRLRLVGIDGGYI